MTKLFKFSKSVTAVTFPEKAMMEQYIMKSFNFTLVVSNCSINHKFKPYNLNLNLNDS